jgi:crossover junction endodeoxyribonuclease RuvC
VTFRVVGLDSSLTGFGVARSIDGRIETRVIKSTGYADASLADRIDRVRSIVRRVTEFALEGYEPAEGEPMPLFPIEQPAYSKTQGHMHDRSGVWWMVVHILAKSGAVVEVAPTTLKRYATRKGNSPKDAVLAAAVRTFPDVRIEENNTADAVWLMAMGLRRLGRPIEPARAAIDETALESVQWPEVVRGRRPTPMF